MFYSRDKHSGEVRIGFVNNRWLYIGLDCPFGWRIIIDEPLEWDGILHSAGFGPVSVGWSFTGSLIPE